jgi:hypothetical protein
MRDRLSFDGMRPRSPSSIDEWRDPVRDLNWVSAIIGRA